MTKKQSLGEATQFQALDMRLALPTEYKYFDLGQSVDFIETIHSALRAHLPPEVPESGRTPKFDSRARTRDGYCQKITLHGRQGDREFTEKYAFVVYRPNNDRRLWFTRGHEEGHALVLFGLEDEIERMTGESIKRDNEEQIADLCGLHALKIRNLDDQLRPRMRAYYGRAKE